MSGVVVNFGVKTDAKAALVVLTSETGAYLPEGSEVELAGSGEPFVMGYDGQVYLTGLSAENEVTVKASDKECHARFSYAADASSQAFIGPVKCL
jgi:outer membrane usher protein